MDAAEYRRQYEAELEQAAEEQVSFRDLLEGSTGRPATRRNRGFATTAGPSGDDDLRAAVAVVGDGKADAQLRSAALQVISIKIDEHPELIDTLLRLLQDSTLPSDQRIAVLNVLQEISFRMVSFPAKRPDYLAALRSIIEDPDAQLRRQAIGILAREKDDFVQRRLIDGLEGRSKALVPAAKAIQFLGYDVHSDYFPLLRRIVEHPPSLVAKKEAVGLLAADPSSKDLLLKILKDKDESPEVKLISAIALQTLAPKEFEEQARRIVLDEDEDDQLRALSLNALTYFANPAAMSQDEELTRRVGQMRKESTSRHLKKATAGYMAKYGT
jgi:hypothetical protein